MQIILLILNPNYDLLLKFPKNTSFILSLIGIPADFKRLPDKEKIHKFLAIYLTKKRELLKKKEIDLKMETEELCAQIFKCILVQFSSSIKISNSHRRQKDSMIA